MYGNNTVKDIQSIIKSLLQAELGTFANGQPAISVIPPTAPQKGTGLHVKVERTTHSLTSEKHQWRVFLIQYDRTDTGLAKYDRAIAKMRQRFPVRREIPTYAQENNNDFPCCVFYLIFDRSAFMGIDAAFL